MSQYPRGGIRPNLTDLHVLSRALITADAVAALIENAVAHPENVTKERLLILADGLRHAADTIDPRLVRTVGGLNYG